MKEKYCKYYNPKAINEINLEEQLINFLKGTDSFVRYIVKLQPEIKEDYMSALEKRLADQIKDYTIKLHVQDLSDVKSKIEFIQDNNKLMERIIQFICVQYQLPANADLELGMIEVESMGITKAMRRLSYYRVKAFIDVLGEEQGIQLYKQILAFLSKEIRLKNKEDEKVTVVSKNKDQLKAWKDFGLADFTFTYIDKDQIIYRFDKCIVHEALKDLNDPDIAYLASCYGADIDEFNIERFVCLRRAKTLHHWDYCDELYWDNRVHADPKHPSLDFIEKIGKE